MSGIKGVIYDFETAGDVLPTHQHTKDDVHISIVCRGSVVVESGNWKQTLQPGQIVDFAINQPHSITALEDNTRVINIVKMVNS